MTDIDPSQGAKPIESKTKFQTQLFELSDRLDKLDRNVFTPQQMGLIQDCRGLLLALANGYECHERSMIRERLLEALALFGSPSKTFGEYDEAQREAITQLCIVLRVSSARGIALDQTPKETGQLVRRSIER